MIAAGCGEYIKAMNTRPKRLKCLIAAAVLFPAAAWADLAVTTQGVNMRAGPDVSYPQVAFLGRGLTVDVVGCVEGYQWCDVIAGPNRGWVYAGYLSSRYRNQPTIISYGGPTIGIPLISFSIGPYWDSYYRGRPWWNNRSYWYSRAPSWHEPPRYVEAPRNYNYGHENRESHGNRGNEWRGNNPGITSDTYTRAEGGTRPERRGPNGEYRGPNDMAHPNAQQ